MHTVNEQWEQLEKQNGGLIETITSGLDNGLDINEVNRAQTMLHKVVINADIKDMIQQFCDKYECYVANIRYGFRTKPPQDGVIGIAFDVAFIFYSTQTFRLHNWVHCRVTQDDYEFSVGRDGMGIVPKRVPDVIKINYIKPDSNKPLDHFKNIMLLSSEELTRSRIPDAERNDQYAILKSCIRDMLEFDHDSTKHLRILSEGKPHAFDTMLRRTALAIEGIDNGHIVEDFQISVLGDFIEKYDCVDTYSGDKDLINFAWSSEDYSTEIHIFVSPTPPNESVIGVVKCNVKTGEESEYEITIPDIVT